MKRWSVIVAGGFSESEISQTTGIRAKSSTSTMAMLQRRSRGCRVSISASRPSFLELARPKPLTKRKAIRKTQMKISTETAEPRPRLSREISWL